MTYLERSTKVARECSISVVVLLNSDNTDLEFLPLAPRQLTESELLTPGEFAARKLRSVGVVGLSGAQARVAFKEMLSVSVVDRIAAAFLEYLRVMLRQGFAEQTEAAEVQELERFYLLEDTRLN